MQNFIALQHNNHVFMLLIDQAVAEQLIFHKVSVDDANVQLNQEQVDLDSEEQAALIKKIFLKPFVSAGVTYEFKDEPSGNNTLYAIARELENDGNFVIGSINICKHLKSVSRHPNIKDGDVFVIKYADVMVNNQLCSALGIYKVENKESFIDNRIEGGKASLKFMRGIGAGKLDKACLIVFTPGPFTVYSIDTVHVDTEYWKNDFLDVKLKKDPLNNTSNFLSLTKSFITEQLPEQFEIEKADQIDLLNRSVKYFKNRDSFTLNDFEDEVLQDPQVIDAFKNYDKGDSIFDVNRDFEISQQAVKQQARIFKSVLKLDKNFHIYIHGNREYLEKGVDEDGRKFYKLYYKEES